MDTALRRGLAWWLVVGVALALCASSVFAQAVVINGAPLVTTRAPINLQGNILLPMRDVFEALNSEVLWFAPEQKIMATRGTTVIQLWLGRRTATVNDQPVNLPVAPTLIAGSTYVPLRFPAEAFGGTVEWQPATRTALINIPPTGGGTIPPPVTPPPVTPPVTPPPVTPPQPVRVEGTLMQIVEAPPSLIIAATGTGLARAIPIGPNTQFLRSQIGGTPHPVALSAALPGDQAMAELGPDRVALTVSFVFGQVDGTIVGISNNSILMQDNTVLGLSDRVDVRDRDGRPLALSAIRTPVQAHVRFNPESRLVWELRLTAAVPPVPQPPPATQPQIMTLGLLNDGRYFRSGDTLRFQMQGTPGGKATVNLGRLARDIQLQEIRPGVYNGEFRIPPNTELRDISINGLLTVGGVRAAPVQSPTRIWIDSTAPVISNMRPAPGRTVNNASPMIELTFDPQGGTDINPASAMLWINRVRVNPAALNVTPERLSFIPENLPPGNTLVEAAVSDMAGNEARVSWSFIVGAVAGTGINAAWHDAPGTLVAGNVLTVTMRVAQPGGVGSFDIGTFRRNQPMQQVGGTNVYRGQYLIRSGDVANNAVVTVYYRDPAGRQSSMEITSLIDVNTTLPSDLVITNPRDGATAADLIVINGQSPPYARVRVTIAYRTRVTTTISGQLWQGIVTANGRGRWETPAVDSNTGFFGRADEYPITAELLDASGRSVAQQRITLRR